MFTTSPNEYAEASSPGNIFQYDNITFISTYNAYEDQLYVYSIIRAMMIIKIKYPEVYKTLFLDTQQSPLQNSSLIKDIKPIANININKNYVFVIHQNNKKPANSTTTSYSVSYRRATEDFRTSDNNTHLIYINKSTLRNGGAYSLTNPLYPGLSQEDARIKFLFDGIAQMIIHERIHDYVSNNLTVNKFLNYIRNDNSLITGKPKKDDNGNEIKDSSGNTIIDNSTYTFYEEPITTNTTNIIFAQYGGLSKEISSYYENLFKNTQLPEIKKFTKYNDVSKKIKELNTKATKNDETNLLRIYF